MAKNLHMASWISGGAREKYKNSVSELKPINQYK
jgi:hypothetical protein